MIFPTIKRRIDGQPGVAGKLFLSLFFFVFFAAGMLFAALIGSLVLKEGFGWRRMAGAATVVAGVAALKL